MSDLFRMKLQNPGPKNLVIKVTLAIRVNYGDAENSDNPYSSEKISGILDDVFKCERCDAWHLNPDICGMDEMTLEDIEDVEVYGEASDEEIDAGVQADESRIERGQNDWSEGRKR